MVKKVVQEYEKSELEEFVKQEDVFVVIPEKVIVEEKKEEKKPQKKLKLFKRHKKPIDVNKIKNNIYSKMYTNRFIVR
ncbi:MAG: hypothetical protein ACW98X_15535 [Promethearchaeota archaeon]